jgi:hypothetical protein
MASLPDIFKAADVMDHVEFVPVEMGKSVFAKGDSRGMTDDAIDTMEACGLIYKGPMETPTGGGGKSINVTPPQDSSVRSPTCATSRACRASKPSTAAPACPWTSTSSARTSRTPTAASSTA